MPFPTRDSLQKKWVQLSSRAAELKRHLIEFNLASFTGDVSASAVEEVFVRLGDFRAYAASAAATPGLAAYVQAQYDDSNLDIVAEYTALIAQINALLTWIVANIPKSGGYVQLDQWSGDGTIARRTFSPAALAGMRAQVDLVTAAIE